LWVPALGEWRGPPEVGRPLPGRDHVEYVVGQLGLARRPLECPDRGIEPSMPTTIRRSGDCERRSSSPPATLTFPSSCLSAAKRPQLAPGLGRKPPTFRSVVVSMNHLMVSLAAATTASRQVPSGIAAVSKARS
jgi:hypothetical protein